ncbi:MAG TPA: cupredoxin domain-containing protein [Longimicrobiales bacterium]
MSKGREWRSRLRRARRSPRRSPRRGPLGAAADSRRRRGREPVFSGRGPVLAALVLSAALGACNAGAQGGTAAEPVETTRVDMPRHYRFAPMAIRVTAGSTVTWTNSDDFTHSVKLRTGDGQVHNVPPGDSVSITFDRPGEYPYVCTFHPHDMEGVVVVTAASTS